MTRHAQEDHCSKHPACSHGCALHPTPPLGSWAHHLTQPRAPIRQHPGLGSLGLTSSMRLSGLAGWQCLQPACQPLTSHFVSLPARLAQPGPSQGPCPCWHLRLLPDFCTGLGLQCRRLPAGTTWNQQHRPHMCLGSALAAVHFCSCRWYRRKSSSAKAAGCCPRGLLDMDMQPCQALGKILLKLKRTCAASEHTGAGQTQ